MNWKWILVLILLIFSVIFTAQNHKIMEINFLFWSFMISRAIMIFLSLILGIIIGVIISFARKK